MFKFGIENLRRLKSVELLDIRPITVLVGRNSAGKSTFLRSFALLRQSITTRISSPILWYGEMVDFGSFKGAVYCNKPGLDIAFSFGIDDLSIENQPLYSAGGLYLISTGARASFKNIRARFGVGAKDETSRLTSLNLTIGSPKLEITLGSNKDGHVHTFEIDGNDILSYFGDTRLFFQQGHLFADLIFLRAAGSSPSTLRGYIPEELRHPTKRVVNLIAPHIDKRLKGEAIADLARSILGMREFTPERIRSLAEETNVKSWQKLLNDIADKDRRKLFAPLRLIFYAVNSRFIIRELNSRLSATLSQTLYIGPARARSERYYRYQDLSVSEIDPDGKNFPMFLNSLTPRQKTSLSDWVEHLFNYRISLDGSGGHISINLIEGDSTTNVVDTGYGVSQILPVLGQIWWSINRTRDNRNRVREQSAVSMLAIEQPELHLHPAHQAMLADALIVDQLVPAGRLPLKPHFVVETHSEAFVNRLGQLISEGKLRAEDVQILVFHPDDEDDRRTNVEAAKFDINGTLQDWPYGFFSPDV